MVALGFNGGGLEIGQGFQEGGHLVEVLLLEVLVGDEPGRRRKPDADFHLVAEGAAIEMAAAPVAHAG